MNTRQHRRLFALGIVSLMLGGCATQIQSMPPAQRADLMNDFMAGRARLECDMSCNWAWLQARGDLNLLYAQQQWEPLARRVIEIGRKEDLAYYWLGRAAEEMGQLQAANLYYRTSAALYDDGYQNYHCRTTQLAGGCFGIDLPAELPQRVARIEVTLLRARQNARAAVAPASATPPARPSTRTDTIDIPPPVTNPQ